MKTKTVIGLAFVLVAFAAAPVRGLDVLVVAGLEGDEEYRPAFTESINFWKIACAKADVNCTVLGDAPAAEGAEPLRDQLKKRLEENDGTPLWLILIGHGTFDGREAKFNVAGDDFTAKELGQWCKGITGELVVVNTASSSAPFLKELAGPNRTIVTATKSPNEIYFTRFGRFFSEAVTGLPEADLDNDDQVSILEAYLYASNSVRDFYEQSGRLATEHALIDDNGDGLGTRSEWFEGATAVKTAKSGAEPDGLRAMQQVLVKNELEKRFPPQLRERRDELERKVRTLRRKKSSMEETEYYRRLELLLRDLAEIYRQADKLAAPPHPLPDE